MHDGGVVVPVNHVIQENVFPIEPFCVVAHSSGGKGNTAPSSVPASMLLDLASLTVNLSSRSIFSFTKHHDLWTEGSALNQVPLL